MVRHHSNIEWVSQPCLQGYWRRVEVPQYYECLAPFYVAHFSFPAPFYSTLLRAGAAFSNRPRHIAHPAIFLATSVTAFVYWATGLATACSFAFQANSRWTLPQCTGGAREHATDNPPARERRVRRRIFQ
ncbi:hypothetical protein B0H14DRAFT_3434701 [Mycena olivaceomarginata]|nr:hypothetical protein B0H14DRAFT_3434701 [Mycena olivaceomarginata]